MLWDNFLLLAILILAFYATPGPATISLVASGISFGFKKSVPYVWGIITGGMFVIASSFAAIILLISIDDLIATIFKYISLIYMLYLVYKIWNADQVELSKSQPLTYFNGVFLNLLNPKAYIATIAILAQFVDLDNGISEEIIVVISILLSISIIDFGFCYLGETLFKILSHKKGFKRINKVMAILLLGTVLYIGFM